MTGASYQDRVVINFAWVRLPEGKVQTNGRISGFDPWGDLPHDFVLGSGPLRALRLAERYAGAANPHLRPSYIEVRPGKRDAQPALRTWVDQGTLGLVSTAGAGVVEVLYGSVNELERSLIINGILGGYFEASTFRDKNGKDVVYVTSPRAFTAIAPVVWSLWCRELARILQ